MKKLIKKKKVVNYKKIAKDLSDELIKERTSLSLARMTCAGLSHRLQDEQNKVKKLEEKLSNADKTMSEYYALNKSYREVMKDMVIETDDEHSAEIRELNQKNKYVEAAKEAFYGRSPMLNLLNRVVNPPLIVRDEMVKGSEKC